MKTLTLSVAILVVAAQITSAQEECTALLRSGINNVYTDRSEFRSQDAFFRKLCTRYQNTVKRNLDFGSESFSPEGYNNLTLGASQAEQMASAMCDTQSSASSVEKLNNVAKSTLSTEALAAWTQCLSLAGKNLHITPKYRNTSLGLGGHDQIVFDVRFTTDVGFIRGRFFRGTPEGPMIGGVKASGFTCLGTLKDAEKKRIEANRSYGLECTRHVSAVPFNVGQNSVYAKAHSVYIDTSAGGILLTEPEILAGPTTRELDSRLREVEARIANARVTWEGDIKTGPKYGAASDLATQKSGIPDTEPWVMIGLIDGTGMDPAVYNQNFYRKLKIEFPKQR
jgi:hypothetical protein